MTDKGQDFGRFLDKLKDTIDIVSVISRYVPLNVKGKTWWGCCPFHSEKTPSFAVNAGEQYYKCFGCGEAGDTIKFIQKYENVDFIKAVEILAKMYNMDMPESDPVHKKAKQDYDAVIAANKLVAKHYHENLYTPQGKTAKDYLLNRGLSEATIKKFGIGASISFDSAIKFMKLNKITDELLVSSGIADQKDKRIFDAMANRVVFPIINATGEVVGFSGRTLETDAKFAKYKNTKETVAYKKGQILFGINMVKKHHKELGGHLILVEGQMCTIMLYEKGVLGVVAPLGTAFGTGHIRILKRYADSITVCFDADSAGRTAALRALDLFRGSGLIIKVATLPEGHDPDSYVRKEGKAKFLEVIENAKPWVEHVLGTIQRKYNIKNKTENIRFINEALIELRKLPTIESEVHLKSLAEISGVSFDVLKRELGQTEEAPEDIEETTTEEGIEVVELPKRVLTAYEFTLSSLIHKRENLKDKEVKALLENQNFYFISERLKKLYEKTKDKNFKVADLFENDTEDETVNKCVSETFSQFKEPEHEKTYLLDSIKTIINFNIEKQIEEKQQELGQVLNQEQQLECIKKISELSKGKV